MESKELTKALGGVRTFDLVANVTGFLEGQLDDWPANIQDGILAALERKADEVELPLTVVYSGCDRDWSSPDDMPRFYVRVIASEIVVADDRYFQQEKDKIKGLIADIVAGRRTQ